jgi:hypothetical protein
MVQGLAPLLYILQFPGYDCGQENYYPDWKFSRFSSVPPRKFRDNVLNWATTISFHILYSVLYTDCFLIWCNVA